MSNYSYDITRGLHDFYKEMEKSEKEFNKPLFNVENRNSESVQVKAISGGFAEYSSTAITNEIFKVYSNIRNKAKGIDYYYSTNTATAIIVSALNDQSLMRSGYCAEQSTYDQVRVVAKNASCVYFVACKITGLIKIGVAANVHKRLSSLQVGSPTGLFLLGAVVFDKSLEKDLHNYFQPYHSHGEWFYGNKEILRIVERLSEESALHDIFNHINLNYQHLFA